MQVINTNQAVAEAWAKLPKSEKMALTRENFEKNFGVDQATRRPAQWKALVAMYSMKTVCAIEVLTQPEVLKHINETFSQHLSRQLRNKRKK
jgi:hypothetical protein